MKYVLLLLAAFILMCPRVQAQNPTTITLESAVKTALDRNFNVIQARNSVAQAQSSQQAAFGQYLPDLGINGGFNRTQTWTSSNLLYIGNGQYIPNPAGSQTQINASNRITGGISSSVTLFNGFATTYNVQRSEASTNAAQFSSNRTEQSTIFQTHQFFLNVVRTYELMKVSDENVKRDQQQLERITESNKVGAVALADVYHQQVQVGQDQLALIQAQSNYEKAKADMLAFLGVEVDREYTFDISGVPSDIDTTDFAGVNQQYANFGGLVSSAIEKRPDYQAAVAALNSSEAGVSASKAQYFPVISGGASYGYANDAFSTLPDNRSLGFNLNLNFPIFNGFQRESNIEQAQIQRQNADEQVRQNQRQLTVDIRKALLDLEASEKEIRVTKASVVSAQLDQQIAQEKYNLGSGTLLDLLIANANLAQAQSNKVNAVNDYLMAKKGIEFAVGTIAQ